MKINVDQSLQPNNKSTEKLVILIDGQCHMCQAITRFLVKNDHKIKFRFAALQSTAGQQLLNQSTKLKGKTFDSFVLYDNGHYWIKSSGALRVLMRLGGWWTLLYGFIIIPAPIRNVIYHWVARNRYRWFGKSDVCLMPTREVMSRFLENGVGNAETEQQ
ncbi:thiol-disulfide oxidoreductase DCC family protein [Paenibacillus sp. L3-i20]|uniref:thiol-disulfide oxidoreductase DCC family protein n=1 Tax=Paenibacillus sp. L3-i20 TaxID=2905833 RepID=UPI001EDE972B|nr:DCC1-like thiol-disulfide oxidoreductase family protein [Paenibacillus sp. L3-i20]GKU79220.1 thiol-disulfide oxidoreductase [Paenibacillus sp. L3-i20]